MNLQQIKIINDCIEILEHKAQIAIFTTGSTNVLTEKKYPEIRLFVKTTDRHIFSRIYKLEEEYEAKLQGIKEAVEYLIKNDSPHKKVVMDWETTMMKLLGEDGLQFEEQTKKLLNFNK